MAYIHSHWTSKNGNFMIDKKYHSWRFMPKAPAVREQRQPKRWETPIAQEKINQKRRIEETTRLMMDNFHPGDTYFTLTFREKFPAKEIKRLVEKFKRQIRDRLKRHGTAFKYLSVIENMGLSAKGRPHAHILTNQLTEEELQFAISIWKMGRVKVERYGGTAMDAAKLSEYFCKEEIDKETGSGRIALSQNLLRREPVKTIVTRSETYREEIRAPKGYRVVEALSYNVRTEEGYPIQVAVFERIGGML